MKGKLTEQYDLVFTKAEMQLVLAALLHYEREFDISVELAEVVAEMAEVFQGEVPRPPGDSKVAT